MERAEVLAGPLIARRGCLTQGRHAPLGFLELNLQHDLPLYLVSVIEIEGTAQAAPNRGLLWGPARRLGYRLGRGCE